MKFLLLTLTSSLYTPRRNFIRSDLAKFAESHNHIKFNVVNSKDAHSHPKLIGYYVGGKVQVVPLRGKSEKEILDMCNRLRQRDGSPLSLSRWNKALTKKPSYQGEWSPEVWRQFPLKSTDTVVAAAPSSQTPSS